MPDYLMMQYNSRYGLEFDPFLKNSREIFVETTETREVLWRLDFLADTKGFGVLTGNAGRGKTTCLRNWCARLNPSIYKVIYSSLSTLTVMEFYRHLAVMLGGEAAHRKVDNFKIIQAEINRCVLEKRITPVIIIDEANHISPSILNDLKIIFNFEMDSKDRAVVLLAGQPQLNHTLRLAVHEPLRQRIIMNYNMDGISKSEARAYIAEKLKRAGCTQPVFDEAALDAIINTANGAPRMIDKLCTKCLVLGDSLAQSLITADTAMKAINDCQLG